MPRVRTAKAAKDYPHEGIKKGDTYYWWQPYRQRKRRSKDRPRESQLTTSRWSDVYAAREDIEDAKTLEGLTEALGLAIDNAQEVAGEYEEAASHFGDQGPHAERSEHLEGLVSELESAQDEIQTYQDEDMDPSDPDNDMQEPDDFFSDQRDEILGFDWDSPV